MPATPFLWYLCTVYADPYQTNLTMAYHQSYYACLLITYSFFKTYQTTSITSHFHPDITPSDDEQCHCLSKCIFISSNDSSLFKNLRATSPSSPHHHFKSSSRGPSSFLTKFNSKTLKIQASRLAFSLG